MAFCIIMKLTQQHTQDDTSTMPDHKQTGLRAQTHIQAGNTSMIYEKSGSSAFEKENGGTYNYYRLGKSHGRSFVQRMYAIEARRMPDYNRALDDVVDEALNELRQQHT